MKSMFVNLGKSLVPEDRPGILADALKRFGKNFRVVIVALVNDPLLGSINPQLLVEKLGVQVEILEINEDGSLPQAVTVQQDDILIVNGGSTPQQAAMLVHLSRSCIIGKVVNLQKERESLLVPAENLYAYEFYNCVNCQDGHAFVPPSVVMSEREYLFSILSNVEVYHCPACGYSYLYRDLRYCGTK